jgi:hypothetical protein
MSVPLPDSLSSATAGRPRGCSPRPATLSPREPRVWNVAEAHAGSEAVQQAKAIAGELPGFRAFLDSHRSPNRCTYVHPLGLAAGGLGLDYP